MADPCTKFEISRFTRYEAMNDGAKCRKCGGLGQSAGTQGRGRFHHSIDRIRLPIRLLIETMCKLDLHGCICQISVQGKWFNIATHNGCNRLIVAHSMTHHIQPCTYE